MEFLKNWIVFYKKEILFMLLIFLVGSTSFALGYLANREYNHVPIIIEKCSNTSSTSP
jgi:hypothetical protein